MIPAPVRGSISLRVSASSPETVAGSDFSIFVIVHNPFEVPVTLYQVQTHTPVELMDVNPTRIAELQVLPPRTADSQRSALVGIFAGPIRRIASRLTTRRLLRATQKGVATALGTDIAPDAGSVMQTHVQIHGDVNRGSVAGIALNFPENPSSEELDAIFRRAVDYEQGVVPLTLQPGDSVVRQFVLRTRSRVFFTPLKHIFQIQATYALDGADHTATVPYEINIRARTDSIALGGIVGTCVGTALKTLTSPAHPAGQVATALAVAILATLAVVIAFARKMTAQPVVSVEDFWGGTLIGFSVGFFGFQAFTKVFPQNG